MAACKLVTNIALLCSALIGTSIAQHAPAGNYFIQPPAAGVNFDYSENGNYVVGDVINLEWKTQFLLTTLALFQQNNSTPTALLPDPQEAKGYQWTVNVEQFDLSHGDIFFFWVYNGKLYDYNDYSFTSHYFNVLTDGNGTTATASPATATQTHTTPTSSITTNTTSASTSSHVMPQSTTTAPAGGLSSGTKIGVGAGVGAGTGCLLIGVAVGLFLRRRSRPKTPDNESDDPNKYPHSVPVVGTGTPVHVRGMYPGELDAAPQRRELESKERAQELSAEIT